VLIVHFIRVVVQDFLLKKIVKPRQLFAVNKKKERKKEVLYIFVTNPDEVNNNRTFTSLYFEQLC
jgi:hypothetical protein